MKLINAVQDVYLDGKLIVHKAKSGRHRPDCSLFVPDAVIKTPAALAVNGFAC
ncbi:hypothetical protein LN650_10535 [Klebsiella pneumoniae subsp. pneumoniae]|nr:hypothetical protein [Klebsiella pneumoniae subsp. pneumoniae]